MSTTGAATRLPVRRSTARSRKPTSKRALCATSGASPANARKRRRASSGRGAPRSSDSRSPVRRAMVGGSATPGRTSVSNVSSIASAFTLTAPISHIRSRDAESPVVSRSNTMSSASSISVSLSPPSARPTRAPRHSSRASPSTTSVRSERASVAGARSSAKRARAASSGATAPRRAWISSTRRSAASKDSCIAIYRIRTYVRIQAAQPDPALAAKAI